MATQTFSEYLYSAYPKKNSGTTASYLRAIGIIDELLKRDDPFDLKSRSLVDITDPCMIASIIDYIAIEEDKYRKGEKSLFDSVNQNQTSYPNKRFCTAAIRRLGEFIDKACVAEASEIMQKSKHDGTKLSEELMKKFKINDAGSDIEVRAKRRVGQDIFRAMLLKIYHSKCCLTGLEIPEVLRASHIIPWVERVNTRLNPENGLCLSATYDAAFDKYLISFDEDYRLILSPMLKEEYTSDAFKRYFLNFEGDKINLPSVFKPSQDYLAMHREKKIV